MSDAAFVTKIIPAGTYLYRSENQTMVPGQPYSFTDNYAWAMLYGQSNKPGFWIGIYQVPTDVNVIKGDMFYVHGNEGYRGFFYTLTPEQVKLKAVSTVHTIQ